MPVNKEEDEGCSSRLNVQTNHNMREEPRGSQSQPLSTGNR